MNVGFGKLSRGSADMSSTKMDRMNQSAFGLKCPANNSDRNDVSFPQAIAHALRREFGNTHAAVKTVVALTNANERAVKNWIMAKNGPTGAHLIDLLRSSDEVLEAVLRLSGRQELLLSKKLNDSKRVLLRMLKLIDDLQKMPDGPRPS